MTVVAIGPLTNIAALLDAHPGLAPRIGRIVAMGGSLGSGNTAGGAEFNVAAEPEAAHRVLTQDAVPTTLVPFDITTRCLADSAWLAALAATGPRYETLVGGLRPHPRCVPGTTRHRRNRAA